MFDFGGAAARSVGQAHRIEYRPIPRSRSRAIPKAGQGSDACLDRPELIFFRRMPAA